MFENGFAAEKRPLDSIRHERLRRLLAYWEAERAAAAAPIYAMLTLRYEGGVYAYERVFLPPVRRGPEADCLLMAAVLPQALIDLKAAATNCLD